MVSKYRCNLLALPKEPAIMKCFVAPEGCVLGQFDLRSAEPTVLTHLSKDPTLQKIYGKGAWPHHDIYFIAGMKMPGMGDKILKHYDLDNPTKEGIDFLKDTMGEERKKVLKPCYLGWGYGLGKYTLATSADITVSEADQLLKGLDKQFPGKQRLHDQLISMWFKNGGYIINGRGMPVCVDRSKKKDIVNRLIQSTAHDILVRMLWHFNQFRKQHNLKMRPYIPDYHDETIWAIVKGYEDHFTKATNYCFDRINDELGWDGVEIRHGGINFGNTMEIRCEG